MIPAYAAPFWLDWKLIIAGIILYYLQILIFGGCILTYAQYGKWNETFSGRSIIWLGSKFGFRLRMYSIKRFLDILPFAYILIALIYQLILHGPILVKI
jgi:hypothetical protein